MFISSNGNILFANLRNMEIDVAGDAKITSWIFKAAGVLSVQVHDIDASLGFSS